MRRTYTIGISGGSASGKTAFISELSESFKEHELAVLSLDNYYRAGEEQPVDRNGQVNYDLPEAIDFNRLVGHIKQLHLGQAIRQPEYNFQLEGKERRILEIKPAPLIIVEGLFVFEHAELSKLFDLRVIVEAKEEIMLQRRLQRDIGERGVPEDFSKYQWEEHVIPAFEQYIKPRYEEVDIIIVNNTRYTRALRLMKDHLKSQL